jgi:hypothetical protein
METLEEENSALTWAVKGSQLANLIAAEERSLRLYSVLHSCDLKDLLARINAFFLKTLENRRRSP